MLVEEFEGNASVLVHMDPCEPTECPVCHQTACELRSHGRNPDMVWNRDRLIRASATEP